MNQNVLIASQSLMNAELQLLRTHVENGTNGPAVVLITSAESGDGKSLIANSLAECLARTGHKTALLDASRQVHADVSKIGSIDAEVRHDEPVPLSLPPMRQGITREAIQEFFESARASYAYTIVDTAAFLESDYTMVLASLADGIILTVRIGRESTENDHMMVRVLDQSNGNVLGVVTATASVIEQFARQNVPLQLATHKTTVDITSNDAQVTHRNWSFVAGVCVVAILFGSFLGIASNETGISRKIVASSPEPAKAFLYSLAAKIHHPQN